MGEHWKKSREELHEYWRNPGDGIGNLPSEYIKPIQRSLFLEQMMSRYTTRHASVLEIGCNVGRNLNYLREAGYTRLSGVEISSNALAMLRQTYPQLAEQATLYNAPIEDVITKWADNQFELVYTMAVLEHIHTDSEWIFAEMARIASRYIITIEDEHGVTERHFPRNYKPIFEALGFRQIYESDCIEAGLGPHFAARVFQKTAAK